MLLYKDFGGKCGALYCNKQIERPRNLVAKYKLANLQCMYLCTCGAIASLLIRSVVCDLELSAILEMPCCSRAKPAQDVWAHDLLQKDPKVSAKWSAKRNEIEHKEIFHVEVLESVAVIMNDDGG